MEQKIEKEKKGMFHKNVKFKYGTREQLKNLLNINKNLEKVNVYLDTEEGVLYIVPAQKNELEKIFDFDFNFGNEFENYIKI